MRKLLIHWDDALDSGFRNRLEAAFADLDIDCADAQVNQDPDDTSVARLAVLAAGSKPVIPRAHDTLHVLAGPGPFPEGATGLRLEASDIDDRSRRWIAVAEKLGPLVGKPALPAIIAAGDDVETLRLKLDAALARASQSERAAATLDLERNNAVRAHKLAEAALASERKLIEEMQQEIARLNDLASSTVFALSRIPAAQRPHIARARDHAARARLAAARASDAAAVHPDALVWPKSHAAYSGETRNGLPHGDGVIVFRSGKDVAASYHGQFADGVRTGHGCGLSGDGHTWTGEWRDNEACGHGLLEALDGRRFEGEVRPDETGSPRKHAGWTWEAPDAASAASVHTPVTPLLAPPPNRSGG